MTDERPDFPDTASTDDDVGRLIRYAGAREGVDADRVVNAHAKVLEHWQNETNDRQQAQRRRNVTWYAAAASVATVAMAVIWMLFPLLQPAAVPFATVASASGSAYLGDMLLVAGEKIAVSASIHTLRGGHVTIVMEGGHEVRLDENSKMVARGIDRFGLERGAVFIRSGSNSQASVLVETPFGTATDLGTQFIVRLAHRSILVGVREGRVQLEKSKADRIQVEDGSLYMLSHDGLSQFRPIAADDEIWSWVDAAPAHFDIQGATLAAYLAWYATQLGASIEWMDNESEQRAAEITLSGSIDGVSLSEGFDEVRRMAPFDFELTNATLHVKVH